MNIAAAVYKTIDQVPPGRIFGYEIFPEYQEAPEAVVRAVGRRVDRQQLKRLEKGRFYTPKQGILGEVPVGDSELVRNVLYFKGKRCGYITGPALYNRWGLTTQIPKTISVAANRPAQTKDFGTIRVKIVPRRAPISDTTVPLLEILDVFRDAKKIPDTRVENVLDELTKRLNELAPAKLRKLQQFAVNYYNAGARALLGALLTRNEQDISPALRASMNPTTSFRLGVDLGDWPEARAWNIR